MTDDAAPPDGSEGPQGQIRPDAFAATPPLNLPVGSVRAIITLAVLATTWIQLARGMPTSEVLRDTLLLVLGYYFGARGKKAVVEVVADPDVPARYREPLGLPRGSVRIIIVLGFALVAYRLHVQGRLIGASGPPPLMVLVATFIGGTILKGIVQKAERVVVGRVSTLLGHLLALFTLLVVCAYCLAVASGVEKELPPEFVSAFVGIVGFYLGKR